MDDKGLENPFMVDLRGDWFLGLPHYISQIMYQWAIYKWAIMGFIYTVNTSYIVIWWFALNIGKSSMNHLFLATIANGSISTRCLSIYIYSHPQKDAKKTNLHCWIDFSFFWNHPMDIGDSDAWRVLAEATMFFFSRK